MIIKAWPDITTRTSQVAKNVEIFWARWDKYLRATVLTKTVADKYLLRLIMSCEGLGGRTQKGEISLFNWSTWSSCLGSSTIFETFFSSPVGKLVWFLTSWIFIVERPSAWNAVSTLPMTSWNCRSERNASEMCTNSIRIFLRASTFFWQLGWGCKYNLRKELHRQASCNPNVLCFHQLWLQGDAYFFLAFQQIPCF